MSIFTRVCQSCGHEQEARDPATYKGDSWRNLKCKKCKSEDMDYGSKKSPPGYDWTSNEEGT